MLKDTLPPVDFVRWLAKTHPEELTQVQWETVSALYTSRSFREAGRKSGHHKNVAKKAWERLRTAFEKYGEDWETSKSAALSGTSGESIKSASISSLDLSPPPKEDMEKPATSRGRHRTERSYSSQTTTFREVDSTLASLISAEMHDALVKRGVYSKVGEILIYVLTHERYLNVDDITSLIHDPDIFLQKVITGLDTLVKSADKEAIERLVEENKELRFKVMDLQVELENLKHKYKECIDTSGFIIKNLLNEEDLKNLGVYIISKDYWRKHGYL